MASKMFMGDMPELIENILNNLKYDFCSLYSCAFVSRQWCKISIPILWQDPFSFEQNSFFISNYISSLAEDEKLVLKECLKGCDINPKFSETLFDYARFLKVLDLSCLISKVKECTYFKFDDSLTNRIINLLIKLFVESGATLHELYLCFPINKINPETFYSLEQNERFFSRLQNLSLKNIVSYIKTESTTTLLRVLAKNVTKISSLEISNFYRNYEPRLLYTDTLRCIIKSQEQLKQINLVNLVGEFSTGIFSTLESQKNSLQEVIIGNCDYDAEVEVPKNCKNLETLRIRYCDKKLLKRLNYKINNLEIVYDKIDALTIVHILEKSGTLLQRLKLGSVREYIWNEPLLLETLKSFCPNITYLDIIDIGFSTQFIELISNLQKLQFLTLFSLTDLPEEESKIRVMQFAEIIPLTLRYFNLRGPWLNSYIDIFLNHCNAPLKNLLVEFLNNEKHTKALIEFCIRNKTLNYVSVFRHWNLDYNVRKEMEKYVTLLPHHNMVVNF
ncbi:hypothetical protein F8M41_017505 [Gigaspora margarita]|uniref:F-box domain-containing protein n=1 Tax=Gigaspora margarita TaxID=4874 RepID=A0A8H4AN10_GIGMA|nr:hypothetical protein F8M41_017505 [Gigaspora margarita]